MFNNILDTTTGTFSNLNACISLIVSIVCGFVIAYTHMKTSSYSKNFIMSLVILPLLVSIAIMLVNGNLGVGVAILGVFSLVRFRSLPGTSKEIISVFFAMVVGLAIGTGYVVFALIITVITSIVLFILSKIKFGKRNENQRVLKIDMPENLEFNNVFDEVFDKYLSKYSTDKIRTTNMGSIYELTYNITLKNDIKEKDFIDELRIRNGNLKIILYQINDEKEL